MSLARKVSLILAIFLPLVFILGKVMLRDVHAATLPLALLGTSLAQAAEYEDEEEDDNGEEDDDHPRSSTTTSTQTQTTTVLKNVVEYRPVTKTVTVTEPGYDVDTDGDGLMDAIDPDPKVSQWEYFTDADGDGVPNIYDQHPNADDFTYLDTETDANQNGLIDLYE